MRIGPKTRCYIELLLIVGGETFETFMRARGAWSHLSGFATRQSLERCLETLAREGLAQGEHESWVPRLTEAGRRRFEAELTPEVWWDSDWDGLWRFLSFDLPHDYWKERKQLKSWLREQRFGHLQGSLLISCRFEESWRSALSTLAPRPRSIVVWQGSGLAGVASDYDLVASAWDFEAVNDRYREYLNFASQPPPDAYSQDFQRWRVQESAAWQTAFSADPLLPRCLWPAKYLGERAWMVRKSNYRTAIIGS